MTDEKKIIEGLDKELKQLIDAEMNDPVLGKLLNRYAAYVLGKEIKLLFIDKACEWLKDYAHIYVSETTGDLNEDDLINAFRKAMRGEQNEQERDNTRHAD